MGGATGGGAWTAGNVRGGRGAGKWDLSGASRRMGVGRAGEWEWVAKRWGRHDGAGREEQACSGVEVGREGHSLG